MSLDTTHDVRDDAPIEEHHPLAATPPAPAEPGSARLARSADTPSFVGWFAVILAVAGLALGFAALARVGGGDGDSGAAGGSGAAPTIVDIELGALRLLPAELTAPAGPIVLRVTNTDSQIHNLSVLGETTPDLQAGESFELDLGDVAAGEYPMQCDIAGHADAGMKGTLIVSGGSADGATPAAPADDAGTAPGMGGMDHSGPMMGDPAEMQAAMDARALRFVEEAKGPFGGQPLEFTTTPDGYKQFEVTAQVVDWEVEPGKVVKAQTYNGVVPAPAIHVEVGDKVRVILHNELPQPTTIHWHGIRVPNSMDGVPPFTQPAVQPGESFTYEFEAIEPAVGIYHSHNGAEQVLDGLFGAFTIGEMATPQVLLDQGYAAVPDQQINMVLNDAGTIGLSLNGKSFPATEPYTAKVGQTVLVNYFNEGVQAHPMHMHQPLGWIIAKDGKPLITPIPGDTINVAPGERYTVLYKMDDPGVWAWHCHILTHAEGPDGMFGMVTALIVE